MKHEPSLLTGYDATMPADIKEMAARHKMTALAEVVWSNAVKAGMKEAAARIEALEKENEGLRDIIDKQNKWVAEQINKLEAENARLRKGLAPDGTATELASNTPNNANVRNLINELIEGMPPEDDVFFPKWTRRLAREIASNTWPVLHRYPDDICRWCDSIIAASDDEIDAVCASVEDEIEAIDYDDGWPTDQAGYTLKTVCLGATMRSDTRWPAQAGQYVFRFVTGMTTFNNNTRRLESDWLLRMYRECSLTGDEQ